MRQQAIEQSSDRVAALHRPFLSIQSHVPASASIAGRSPMRRYTVSAAVVALAGTMTATAQQKPDFSGDWHLNRHASMLSPIVAPVAQSGTLRIEHKEPNFRCHMTIVLDGKPFETKYEMLSDGRETVATEQGRRPRPAYAGTQTR